ncbi:MAG: FHA domain-containing protein [Chloroflexia bacterium]
MIVCRCCGCRLLEGTLFCPECGASLLPPAEAEEPRKPDAPEKPHPVPARTTAQIAPAQLRLLVLNSGRLIVCPMAEVLLVGRSDPAGGIFPEVDLTQDNAYMAGVSRRHARISRRGDTFFLEDLASANGTYVNRERLPPHTPVPLEDGSEIRLGNLVLRAIIETSSARSGAG